MKNKSKSVLAICPICSEFHTAKLKSENRQYYFTGNGTPRINCAGCKTELFTSTAGSRARNAVNQTPPTRVQRGISIPNWLEYQRSLEMEARLRRI